MVAVARTIEQIEEAFWARVDRRGPEDCWPWTGGIARGVTYPEEGHGQGD